jgi:outer membrane murein-binding lipoprotein Lpp
VVSAGPDGNRANIEQLVTALVSSVGFLAGSNDLAQQVQAMLQDANTSLDQISSVLADLNSKLTAIYNDVNNPQPTQGLGFEITDKLGGASTLFSQVADQVESAYTNALSQIKPGVDDPFSDVQSAVALHDQFLQIVEDKLLASSVGSIVHQAIQQHLYDLNSSIRETADSMFQQVNGLVRDVIAQSLSTVSDNFTSFATGGGSGIPDGIAAAGKMDGYAHITGDSLSELRLNIKAKLKAPDEMKVDAYLSIKELNSQNTASGCLPAGGKATEITMGATGAGLDWIIPNLKATVSAKFTLDPTVDPPALLGLSAGFQLDGPLNFQTFKITSLGAMMGFGSLENYFSADCALEFNGYKGKGGIFFGKTCDTSPFFWDPAVQTLLGNGSFTGAYAYGEVWIPITEALLGIPPSCFLEVSAGVGMGAGYFTEGPTYVGKMFLGVSGSVLCLVSVEGDVTLVGVKNPQGLVLNGEGDLTGTIGSCPFCVSFGKSLGIQYQNGSWGVSF